MGDEQDKRGNQDSLHDADGKPITDPAKLMEIATRANLDYMNLAYEKRLGADTNKIMVERQLDPTDSEQQKIGTKWYKDNSQKDLYVEADAVKPSEWQVQNSNIGALAQKKNITTNDLEHVMETSGKIVLNIKNPFGMIMADYAKSGKTAVVSYSDNEKIAEGTILPVDKLLKQNNLGYEILITPAE